jgi:hypothetical protein
MWNWKSKLAMVAVPAVLAIGVTGVVAQAVGPPTGSPTTNAQTATPGAATEAPETASKTAEANEPSLPGGGHSDPAGQADHQFDGVE